MAKWGNEPSDNTSIEDLKLSQKESIEADAEEQEKLDEEENKRAEEEARKVEEDSKEPDKKDEDDKVDPDKKDEDDEIVDLDELERQEAEEAKKAEEEAAAAKAKADEGKTEEELAQEKKEAEKAAQDEADAKAKKEEEEAEAASKQEQESQEIDIKIGEETYDAERATKSIKKLNEIEEDEFLKNLIDHRNNGGDVLDYLKANDNKEDEMSSEELVRYVFDTDPANVGLGREELDLLWDAEKSSKYPTVVDDEGGVDEKAVKIGTAKLKRDAATAKAKIKTEKAKFKVAKPKTEVASELVEAELQKAKDAQATEQAKSLKEWNDEVDGHQTTKTIQDKGMVVLNVDGKKIGYKTPDAEELIGMTKDLSKFLAKATDDKGHMKIDIFSEIMAFAQNPEKFKSDLVKFGKMQERKSSLKDAKHIDPNKKSGSTEEVHKNKEGMSATMASIKQSKWTTE